MSSCEISVNLPVVEQDKEANLLPGAESPRLTALVLVLTVPGVIGSIRAYPQRTFGAVDRYVP